MTRKQRRLSLIAASMGVFAMAIGIALYALRDSVVFFFTPSEIAAKSLKAGMRLRVGGLIKIGTIVKASENSIKFVITDGQSDLAVAYSGLVPDLFREGQGVIAEGKYAGSDLFTADSVLAKHDERYMPREVADSLKAKGLWKQDANAKTQEGSSK